MTSLRLTVTPRQEGDLRRVAELGPSELRRVLTELDKLQARLSSPSHIHAKFAEWLGAENGSALSRQLFALVSLERSSGYETEDVLAALHTALQQHWEADELEQWDAASPVFGELLNHERVAVTAKALELVFSHDKVFSKADILTDVRPVFDVDHDEVLGLLVSQTLRIAVITDDGQEIVTVSMDQGDIERLLESCKDALRKAEKTKTLIGAKCDVETFIVGDDFYE